MVKVVGGMMFLQGIALSIYTGSQWYGEGMQIEGVCLV